MLGGTLPIPLYALRAPRMGFGPFTTTLVFAVYALGTVLALMAFASLSDRVGRRPLLAAAVLATATSTALFLLADDVGTLLTARFLCGIRTGVFTATATAAMGDLAGAERTRRVSTVSTAANMGGVGLGTVAGGLFAQYGANLTHLVFWSYLAGLVPAFLAVIVTPETVTARQWITRRRAAPAFLVAGVAVFEARLWARSLPTFAGGTLLAGTGVNLAFRRGVGGAQRLADPRRTADRLSTYFLFAYTGTIVPTLALGLLDQTINQDVATLILAVAVVATPLASALSRPTTAIA
ncbi:MFS transporter [Streptomyces mirabilis]|uniref:MFS transporter n=1 Tax=Streptomyces mirabilis TaxID=68239 RepID=UPI0036BF68C0